MRKVQALNINNSYRSLNLNTRLAYSQVQKVIQVTRLNEVELLDQIKNGTLDKEARYILYHFHNGIGELDTLNTQLMELGVPISYYTNDVAPLHVLKGLANNSRGEVVYQLQKEFTPEQVKNVHTASQLCRTTVDCPIIYPDIESKSILFSMWDLRYLIDRIDLSFPALNTKQLRKQETKFYTLSPKDKLFHLNQEARLGYYIDLHEILARWKIQLWFICNTKEEMQLLEDKGELVSHELR